MLLYDSRFSGAVGLDIGGVWAERAKRFPPPEALPSMPEPLGEGEASTPEYEQAVKAATPSADWLKAKAASERVPVDWDGDADYYAYETTLPPAVEWSQRARPGPGYRRRQTWIVDELAGEELEQARKGVVPREVGMWQARTVLGAMGLIPQIDTAIAGLPEPQRSAAYAQWEYAPNLRRDAAFVAALGPVLGLDDNQIDALFVQAAQVT